MQVAVAFSQKTALKKEAMVVINCVAVNSYRNLSQLALQSSFLMGSSRCASLHCIVDSRLEQTSTIRTCCQLCWNLHRATGTYIIREPNLRLHLSSTLLVVQLLQDHAGLDFSIYSHLDAFEVCLRK